MISFYSSTKSISIPSKVEGIEGNPSPWLTWIIKKSRWHILYE